MCKGVGVWGRAKKKQRCGEREEKLMGSVRTRKNRGEQPRGSERERERERERETEREGEVGGCMWVPVRRETAGLSQREREREREKPSISVCGYETERIISQCVDAA